MSERNLWHEWWIAFRRDYDELFKTYQMTIQADKTDLSWPNWIETFRKDWFKEMGYIE